MAKKKSELIDGSYILNLEEFLDTRYSRYDVIQNCIKIIRNLEKEQHFIKEPINRLALKISRYTLENFDKLDDFIPYYYHKENDNSLNKN